MLTQRLIRGLPLLALGLSLLTCGEEPSSPADAGVVPEDGDAASAVDAGEGLDASPSADAAPDAGADAAAPVTADSGESGLDAAEPGVDAAEPGADAASPGPDAGDTPDAARADAAWCTAGGIPGSCLDLAECTGTRQPTAGLCPGPTQIQCCTPRYAAECDPNARPQPNAGLTEEAGGGGCPAGMLRISNFCIDRFEASLEEVLVDGSRVPWSPYFSPAGRRVRAVSLRGAVPQGYVNETQAAAACAEAGKRMCSNAEWLRACQGPSPGTTYPYGNTRQTGVCNDHRSQHPAAELYGTGSSWIYSHIDSPCLNQLADGLAATGAYAGCVSAEGVHDMMGNLHEWTGDPAGTFRGGFYVDTVVNGPGCLYATTAHDTSHWDYSTGFRCCAD